MVVTISVLEVVDDIIIQRALFLDVLLVVVCSFLFNSIVLFDLLVLDWVA